MGEFEARYQKSVNAGEPNGSSQCLARWNDRCVFPRLQSQHDVHERTIDSEGESSVSARYVRKDFSLGGRVSNEFFQFICMLMSRADGTAGDYVLRLISLSKFGNKRDTHMCCTRATQASVVCLCVPYVCVCLACVHVERVVSGATAMGRMPTQRYHWNEDMEEAWRGQIG